MELHVRSLAALLARAVVIASALTCALSLAAWAGGAGFGDDDDNSEEEGPSYFGFVRDANGATISDAKVTVGVKNRGGVVTRTDLLGTYKVPGFGKDVDPKDVQISCDKQGYKQLRVVRRSTPSNDPKIPIETECTLQRI
ncbi:MAG: carboxypeptidase regulatory-like domain-containing protein [Alphaproteobacteria bacterium]|nr:MAG: carboxypeptidase regulatory-like domain-containing protein [Alphaproteobacteria bacterium]